ncbi:hypothetical protein J1605_020059 [Eschrichtius robustus]|uniref:Uncharacterized protein n=1 Tax=Eschrichtius robustus TaxID=9764 RepID=A0AB34HM29_ESCRO|nr:hypothetical protein J1605_020059 [Eschrichtius robustus]
MSSRVDLRCLAGIRDEKNNQGAQRMEISQWQPLITGLMAVAHCPALVNQEDSDLTNPSPQDSLGLPQKSPRAT